MEGRSLMRATLNSEPNFSEVSSQTVHLDVTEIDFPCECDQLQALRIDVLANANQQMHSIVRANYKTGPDHLPNETLATATGTPLTASSYV